MFIFLSPSHPSVQRFRDELQRRAETWLAGSHGDLSQLLEGQVLVGHLRRLRQSGPLGDQVLESAPPVKAAAAARFIREARAALEQYAARVAAEPDSPSVQDGAEATFRTVLDALVLAAEASESGEAYAAGRELMAAASQATAAMLPAEDVAAAAAAAYERGLDAPRLFCRAIASAREEASDPSPLVDLAVPSERDLREAPRFHAQDVAAQGRGTLAFASAKGDADQIGLDELARRWQRVELWTVEGADVRFTLRTDVQTGLLRVAVAPAGSSSLDGYRFRVTVGPGFSSDGLVKAGQTDLALPTKVAVASLRFEGAAPGGGAFRDCVEAAED